MDIGIVNAIQTNLFFTQIFMVILIGQTIGDFVMEKRKMPI